MSPRHPMPSLRPHSAARALAGALLTLMLGLGCFAMGHHYGRVNDARNLTYAYGCGYIAGQHEIMRITNVPVPHRPASANMCEPMAKIAAAGGFTGSKTGEVK